MAGSRRPDRISTFLLPLLVSLTACAHDASRTSAAAVTRPPAAPDPFAAVAQDLVPDSSYRVEQVARPGTIAGRITVDSLPARYDTTLTGPDAADCGTTVRDASLRGSGRALEGVLVWVSGIRAGQALPRLRRTDLAIVRCQFVPHVLALVQGTTINLQSQDDMVHRTRFYSESADSLISRLVTTDRWAVIPTAKIAADPGLVRVRLTRHPFVRGFVAVFQHPYFAVTNRAGRYRIRGLAAGTYHVKVWHERGGDPVDRVVTVKAGLLSTFDTTLVLH